MTSPTTARRSREKARTLPGILLLGVMLLFGVFAIGFGPPRPNMLILRGIAGDGAPRGLLDDRAALAYARATGYRGEVLNVASNVPAEKSQVQMALERIHHDPKVKAIYGFSGGGYNARTIWQQLDERERKRIRRVVVIGSPGVSKASFPGAAKVVIREDPPEGHMAGPRKLLQAVQE